MSPICLQDARSLDPLIYPNPFPVKVQRYNECRPMCRQEVIYCKSAELTELTTFKKILQFEIIIYSLSHICQCASDHPPLCHCRQPCLRLPRPAIQNKSNRYNDIHEIVEHMFQKASPPTLSPRDQK